MSTNINSFDLPKIKLLDCKEIYDKCVKEWYNNQNNSYNDCVKLFKEFKKLIKIYNN